ncbi:MAG TPA: NHLP family bacteriocin export ABC transporter peptidase/permease/ATPase subunit [Microlunatus sp.]
MTTTTATNADRKGAPASGSRRVRTRTVLQMEAVECGAASLAMVLAHHGRVVPLTELRQACGVSRDGSKASSILKAARTYGLAAKGFRKEPRELKTLSMPVIAFWEFNHFVVVDGFSHGQVYLNDPASGPRIITDEEFDRSFTGIVLTFEPSEEFTRGGRFPSLTASLRRRLRGSRAALVYGILAGLALIIPGLLIPAFSRIFVDGVLVGGFTDWLAPLVVAMALALLLLLTLTLLQADVLQRLGYKLELTATGRFFWHVLHLPIGFFDLRYAADIASRTQLNQRLAQLLSARLATNLVSLTLIAFYAIVMLQYSVLLATIGVGISLLNLLALRLGARGRRNASRRFEQDQGKVVATSFSGIQMIETLKSGGTESDFFARWAGFQAKSVRAEQDLATSTSYLSVVPPLLTGLTTAAILIIGGQQVIIGALSIGALVAFQYLLTSFSAPVGGLVTLGGEIQEIEAGMVRLDDVLDYPSDPVLDEYAPSAGPTDSSAVTVSRLSGALDLRSITFGYNPLAPPLITDFNLSVPPGARVALIGGSGSGKSTIARIVCGLYRPWSGEVLFDGHSRSHYPRDVLVNSLALVDQEIVLVEGSVTENLTLWDPTVPEHQVVQAGRDAAIHADIAARSGGYASAVAEGGRNWSGGQRQRLEIARALVTDPSILVLDEATSALDPTTEQFIDEQLRRRGCTCLIVAHRLSTIRDCDEIVVLDRGSVVQRGTHESLVDQGGLYTQLIAAG